MLIKIAINNLGLLISKIINIGFNFIEFNLFIKADFVLLKKG